MYRDAAEANFAIHLAALRRQYRALPEDQQRRVIAEAFDLLTKASISMSQRKPTPKLFDLSELL